MYANGVPRDELRPGEQHRGVVRGEDVQVEQVELLAVPWRLRVVRGVVRGVVQGVLRVVYGRGFDVEYGGGELFALLRVDLFWGCQIRGVCPRGAGVGWEDF